MKPSFRRRRRLGGKPSGAGVYPHEDAHVVEDNVSARIYNFSTLVSLATVDLISRGYPMPQSRPTDARINELAEKKAQLDAQIAALDARRRLSEKKDEDRLKWLLGNLVFDRLSAEPVLQELVRRDLPNRLTQRDRSRGLWQILFPDTQEDRP